MQVKAPRVAHKAAILNSNSRYGLSREVLLSAGNPRGSLSLCRMCVYNGRFCRNSGNGQSSMPYVRVKENEPFEFAMRRYQRNCCGGFERDAAFGPEHRVAEMNTAAGTVTARKRFEFLYEFNRCQRFAIQYDRYAGLEREFVSSHFSWFAERIPGQYPRRFGYRVF